MINGNTKTKTAFYTTSYNLSGIKSATNYRIKSGYLRQIIAAIYPLTDMMGLLPIYER